MLPQDYSMNNHSPNTAAGPTDMSRTAATMSVPPGTIITASTHTPASTATGAYQVRGQHWLSPSCCTVVCRNIKYQWEDTSVKYFALNKSEVSPPVLVHTYLCQA